ncbi:MAG TPA: hypothetical protein VEK34_08890 [Methylocella sp.]|nr:hypothetical protein [Methylocella sp.]
MTMMQPRKAVGKQVLKHAIECVGISCVGAAVFAAPLSLTPKFKAVGASQQTSVAKASVAPLAVGPGIQLGRAGPGEDEDCVRVTRMIGPDGRVYVTRGLICQ